MIHLHLSVWRLLLSKTTCIAFKSMHPLGIKPRTSVIRATQSDQITDCHSERWFWFLEEMQLCSWTGHQLELDRTVPHTNLLCDEKDLEYTVAHESCAPILWSFYGAFTSFLKLEKVFILIAWKTVTKTFSRMSHVMDSGRKKRLETTWGMNKWWQNFFSQFKPKGSNQATMPVGANVSICVLWACVCFPFPRRRSNYLPSI